ncbi:hypothetical protein FB45DRAFT_892584 [Roridomyces roridus]|uniref:Uncharacterized protein n=1 Tax=Roridomyces roridus TaxID=1738132 RepID=A0AAD7FWH2_9AGAR|nr:hypothetical protein FB45DRAFT_892584 [Roridomyces roridus]
MSTPRTGPWFFVGAALKWATIRARKSDGTSNFNQANSVKLGKLLGVPHSPPDSVSNALQAAWEDTTPFEEALLDCFEENYGISRARHDELWSQTMKMVFGENTSDIPGDILSVSAFFRVFLVQAGIDIGASGSHSGAPEPAMTPEILRKVVRQDFVKPLPQEPQFAFHVKLFTSSGQKPKSPSVLFHFEHWSIWFAPGDQSLAFAFTENNWNTLGSFREVLDTLLGRHIFPDRFPPLEIWTNKNGQLARDDAPLMGDFYIHLDCQAVNDLVEFPKPPQGAAAANPQDPQFARKVSARCGNRCAFAGSNKTMANDFAAIVRRFFSLSEVDKIDDPCNGLLLDRIAHTVLDRFGAAISHNRGTVSRLIICSKLFPLHLKQFAPLSEDASGNRLHPWFRELELLLRLRFTMTAQMWFCKKPYKDLVQVLVSGDGAYGSENLQKEGDEAEEESHPMEEDSQEDGDQGQGHVGEPDDDDLMPTEVVERKDEEEEEKTGTEETHISPSTSNSSKVSTKSGNTKASNETDPTSVGSQDDESPKHQHRDSDAHRQVDGEEGEEEGEELEEEFEEFEHMEGCRCARQNTDGTSNDGPCGLLLLGAIQLWSILYGDLDIYATPAVSSM